MKIVRNSLIISIVIIWASTLFSQDAKWDWRLCTKPNIGGALITISMLDDGTTSWIISRDKNEAGDFHSILYFSNDGWETSTEIGDDNLSNSDLKHIDFIDNMTGWGVGVDGAILKTSDGGYTWTVQGAGLTTSELKRVVAVDANHVFTAGYDGTILYTTDGGAKWMAVNTGTTNDFYSIDMHDATHGIAVGKAETALYTTDGVNWSPATTVAPIGGKDYNDVAMMDENTGWLVGDGFSVLSLKSVFAKTTDGGKTWTLWEPEGMAYNNMWSVKFVSPTKGIAAGANGFVFVTTDGNEWTQMPLGFGNSCEELAVAGDKVWSIGGGGSINYSGNFGTSWSILNGIVGFNLYKIAVVDSNKIIGVGYNNLIVQTEDGGETWKSYWLIADNTVSSQLWGVDFLTSDIGWVTGTGGYIAKTTDGGSTWTRQAVDYTANWLYHMVVCNETNVWAIGKSGTIMKTEDQGENWNFQGEGVTYNTLYGIDYLDASNLIIVGDKSTFLYTTNSGQNWQTANHDLSEDKKVYAIDIVDESHAWAVGEDGLMLFSNDNGKNWASKPPVTEFDLSGVCFKDLLTGWVVGDSGTVFETIDGGTNWTQIDTVLTDQYLKSVDITDNGKIFAGGYNGTFIGFFPLPTSVYFAPTETLSQFNLSPNYPNPFNPTTTIEYQIPENCHVTLDVYNALGQKVDNLVMEIKSAGTHRAFWNASNFSSGVYFIKMSTNKFNSTRKILLMK